MLSVFGPLLLLTTLATPPAFDDPATRTPTALEKEVQAYSFDCVDTSEDACATELAMVTNGFGFAAAIAVGPTVYLTQTDAVPEIEDAPGWIMKLIKAVQDKDWQLAVGLVVLLLVMLANFILLKLGLFAEEMRKEMLPWIAAISGCLMMFSSTLIAGGSWLNAGLKGFATGAVAIGMWELVFRRIRKWLAKRRAKKQKKPPPT